MAATVDQPTAEDIASLRFGGTRARPRKGIEGVTVTGQTYLKPPGSCLTRWPGLGVAVEVECCADCHIYVLDPTERVQISECKNCRIVVGPCVGSLMLFDCTDCTVTIAAKQIRLRDCFDCELRVFAPSSESVVIETCKRLNIGGWDVAYAGLAAHFATARWQPNSTNYSSSVYDFSPPEGGGKNWSPVGADAAGRWCELKVESTEGMSGGRVSEHRTNQPSIDGCECPCAAPDGSLYEASWYSTTAAVKEAAVKEAAGVQEGGGSAKAAASKGGASTEKMLGDSSSEPAERGFVRRALGWLSAAVRRLAGAKSAAQPAAASPGDIDVRVQGQPGGAGGKSTQVCAIS